MCGVWLVPYFWRRANEEPLPQPVALRQRPCPLTGCCGCVYAPSGLVSYSWFITRDKVSKEQKRKPYLKLDKGHMGHDANVTGTHTIARYLALSTFFLRDLHTLLYFYSASLTRYNMELRHPSCRPFPRPFSLPSIYVFLALHSLPRFLTTTVTR
jgi:hypothetical protein